MLSIGHLWIPVSNLDRSVEFYKKLGMVEKIIVRVGDKDVPELKDSYAQLETTDKNVLVTLLEKKNFVSSGVGIIVGFMVDNLSKAMQAFTEKGIHFMGGIIEVDDRRFINFQDPDRHLLQLSEMRK